MEKKLLKKKNMKFLETKHLFTWLLPRNLFADPLRFDVRLPGWRSPVIQLGNSSRAEKNGGGVDSEGGEPQQEKKVCLRIFHGFLGDFWGFPFFF